MTADPADDPWGELVTRVTRSLRRRTGGDEEAEDLVHAVLLRMLEQSSALDIASPEAWLRVAARNALADHHRQRERKRAAEARWTELASKRPEEAPRDLLRCLVAMLEGLEEEDASLLKQVDLSDISQVELARTLGLTVSGVKSRVQRARQKLRALLEGCCDVELAADGSPLAFDPRPGRSCGPACDGDSGSGCR